MAQVLRWMCIFVTLAWGGDEVVRPEGARAAAQLRLASSSIFVAQACGCDGLPPRGKP